jgi:hypothetical protein
MELGGNLKERVVTIGNSTGLLFTGAEGSGVLTGTQSSGSAQTSSVAQTSTGTQTSTATDTGTDAGSGTQAAIAAAYVGNANITGWPGMDQVTPANGVDAADGSGFRGGSWADTANYLRTSDRSEAARTDTSALNTYGGRGVRTYDGN